MRGDFSPEERLTLILLRALESDFGVKIKTKGDVNYLRQRLYKAKKEDPRFAQLSIVVPKEAKTIWIVRRPKDGE